MKDAIDLLLQDKQHADAVTLLNFHRANPEFLPRIVAEFRLLKQLGRRAGGVKSLIHFLRWDRHWHEVDEFEVNQNLGPLAIRVCTLLWPDINGMVQFRQCKADEILGTRIVRRVKRYGNCLYPGKRTLAEGCRFLRIEKGGAGLVRPIQWDAFPTVATIPPPVPVLERPGTMHDLISEAEARKVVAPLRDDVLARAPNPRNHLLCDWLKHVEAQPELFAFMQSKLRERELAPFSAPSILEYCRWSIRRAAEIHKHFTLSGRFDGLYCRALITQNPEFNGYCKFKDDGKTGRSNRLLGCTLAPESINGEPYRRLVWSSAK